MKAIEQALLWLDADTTRFWILAWGSFALTGLAAVLPSDAPSRPERTRRPLLFAAGVIVTMAAFRWPVWFYPHELNPDESQTIAGAITLARFPVYWKFVDGTTHGPWCEYLLVWAHWLGAPLNYLTARVVSTLLEAGSVLALWGTLRCCTTERMARTSALPALAFWSFSTWDDFVHYSSELPSVFFFALAGWLIALVLTASRKSNRHLFYIAVAGCCLGCMPFAKLQSTPLGIALGSASLYFLWRHEPDTGSRRRLMTGLAAGALAPALIVAVFLTLFGLWGHFVPSYLLSALAYLDLGQHPLAIMPIRFFNFSATEPAFAWFFWGCLGFSLLYARASTPAKTLRTGVRLGWLLLAVAGYSVLRPGREVVHYLHLIVVPLTLLTGFTLAAASTESSDGHRLPPAHLKLGLLFVSLALLPQLYHRAVTWHRFAGHVGEYRQEMRSEAASFIRERSRPGDTLAMWGWECHLLVETGLPHGTREAHSANQLSEWPLRDYFTKRYLWDMERRQPAWFVDAVGPDAFIYKDRTAWGHESVPELLSLIDAKYDFMAEFQNKRIYRRKDLSTP